MKFLYISDTHIRASAPTNRLDDFVQTLRDKFADVSAMVRQYQVDAVLHGGDFFDIPNPSLAVCGEFVSFMSGWGVPIYGIAGNHDIYGHNPDTLPRTMLGFIAKLGLVRLIEPGERIYLEGKGVRVQLSGQHYHYDLDRRDPTLDYCVEKRNADMAIHLTHGMLLDRAMMEGVAHTVVDKIVQTEADLTLCGHNHLGFPAIKVADKVFYNPGGFVRMSNHPLDAGRTPQALLIEVDQNGWTYLELPLPSVRSGIEVLDTSRKEETAFMEQRLAQFVQGIREAGDYKKVDVGAIIDEIAGRGELPDPVRKEAMRRIAAAQERLAMGGDSR